MVRRVVLRRWFRSVAAGSCALTIAATALGTNCHPESGVSPCFEADALRVPSGHARFAGIASPLVVPEAEVAFSLATTFLYKPLLLNAPSPAAEGRDIVVVERELGMTFGAAVGLGERLELDVSLPVSTARSGSGVEGVTTQQADPLPRSALRDPRLGLSWSPLAPSATRPYGLEARLELSLPFGDEAHLAGYAGPGFLPAVDGEYTLGRLVLAGELGARLGQAVDFASTRQGNELFVAAGVGFDVLSDSLLAVSLESWLRQPLESEPDQGLVTAQTRGPAAEWLLGLRTSNAPFSIFAGAGTGIPLARETHDGAADDTPVSAPTTPAFRAVVVLRHAPEAARDAAVKTAARR